MRQLRHRFALAAWTATLAAIFSVAACDRGQAQSLLDSHMVKYGATRVDAALNDLSAGLAARAPLASPTFTGDPRVPTPATGDADTSIANTGWVAAGYQPLSANLTSLSGASAAGLYWRASGGAWAPASIGSGVAFNATTGVLSAIGSGGTVTSVALASSDLSCSGSPVTAAGTITCNLAASGVTAGVYGDSSHVAQVTVAAGGRVTAAAAVAITPAAIGAPAGSGASSGTNTGDETSATIKTKLGITTLSGSNTGDETSSTILSKLGITTLSGSNTGDETTATIKTKLGITTLSGSNTGDETGATILSKLGLTTLSGSNTGDQTFSLTVPSWFTAGASSTSALSFTANSQAANTVLAGPSSGAAAAPGFRALVPADIPSIDAAKITTGTLATAQTAAITGDVTKPAGSNVSTLATAQPAVHTWALQQTLTVAPAFGDPAGTRQALSTQVAAYNLAGTDANATLSVATRPGTYIHNVTLTADRTYTLSPTGAYAGMRWRMVRKGSGAFNWIIKDQTAAVVIKNLATGQWMDVEFDGASWQEVAFGSL